METDIQERIRTEIELAAENSIIINQEYLDEEQLTRERQFEVLTENLSRKGPGGAGAGAEGEGTQTGLQSAGSASPVPEQLRRERKTKH